MVIMMANGSFRKKIIVISLFSALAVIFVVIALVYFHSYHKVSNIYFNVIPNANQSNLPNISESHISQDEIVHIFNLNPLNNVQIPNYLHTSTSSNSAFYWDLQHNKLYYVNVLYSEQPITASSRTMDVTMSKSYIMNSNFKNAIPSVISGNKISLFKVSDKINKSPYYYCEFQAHGVFYTVTASHGISKKDFMRTVQSLLL